MTRVAPNVWLHRVSRHVWIHTTTHVLDGVGYYPANGAIVVDGRASLLIDTGWNDGDAVAILNAWERMSNPPITRALVTHFHSDRLGGIAALARRGIPAFANPLTIGLAIDRGFPAPHPLHGLDRRTVTVGRVAVSYPGAGHTIDNVVAWIPGDDVLFAGCLVKATTARDLGNVADGDLSAYPATIRRVTRAYAPRQVIPGHGTIAGNPLGHTETMALAAAPR